MTNLRRGLAVSVFGLRDGLPRISRRRDDDRLSRRLLRLLGDTPTAGLDPAAAGRGLLMLVGVLTLVTAPLLEPRRSGWTSLGVVSVCMAIALVISTSMPWSRLPRRACLVFPIAAMLALGAIGYGQHGVFGPLGGVLTLCFAYVGLTQPRLTALPLSLPCAASFLAIYGEITTPVVIRLLIAISVWILLAELLAGFTYRQAELAAALRTAAFTDVLTGVANRRDLDMRLQAATVGDALVLCDLDHFKTINDTAGHDAGDRVLADFGFVLRASLRDGDYCARLGGEEFVLVLAGTASEDALQVVSRLRERWRVLRPEVTFSTGVSIMRAARSPHDTLAAADMALYAAKSGGRDTDRVDPSAVLVG